ncbi:MAG: type II toxin-antitoxin system HicB family antitoxin [Bacteroidota bacterium]|nr:type II toxin-antitoxin system HicB family antitoxin [Bacteroidota bacterium]MDP4229574.1 type II toxin-antitoxin system HicB family antitoxin [Bacteroidota bacterium]MDP4237743.1 type II toxin-antitoxin system HicB family antitoxin [Bacteroidota bacterium]
MHTTLTAVFRQRGDWYIGYVEELPGANVQEHTLDEARESLKEAVTLIIESNRAFGREELNGDPVVREEFEVEV